MSYMLLREKSAHNLGHKWAYFLTNKEVVKIAMEKLSSNKVKLKYYISLLTIRTIIPILNSNAPIMVKY